MTGQLKGNNTTDLVPKGAAIPRQLITGLRCIKEVSEFLQQGLPLTDIATFIQNDRLEALDVPHDALIVRLREFRSRLDEQPSGEAEGLPNALPDVILPRQAPVKNSRLDESLYLTQLATIQMSRITDMRQDEIDNSKMNPHLQREIQVAVELAATHAKVRDLLNIKDTEASATPAMPNTHADEHTRLGRVLRDPKSLTRVVGVLNGLFGRATLPLHDVNGELLESSIEEMAEKLASAEEQSPLRTALRKHNAPVAQSVAPGDNVVGSNVEEVGGEAVPAPEEDEAEDAPPPEALPAPYNPFEDDDD